MQNQYIAERENANSRDTYHWKVVRIPPIACEFFVNVYSNPELESKRAGYHYYGYQFARNLVMF
jgi:hypothetical protein